MFDYYDDKLSAEKLRRVYDVAPQRVQQYLHAEIQHLLFRIHPGDTVLELGCGFGRILEWLVDKAGMVVGIDTSLASLKLAQETLSYAGNCHLLCMDATRMGFLDHTFDVVVCVQNGISAFHVDPRNLIEEAVRVTRPGGRVTFSSYSEKFWPHRLKWFEVQANLGLLGEIDYDRTGNGQIVCKDGFTATTVTPEQFRQLTRDLNAVTRVFEVDESSVFCEISPGPFD